jgi:uncharacterized protein (TIGR00369 family)
MTAADAPRQARAADPAAPLRQVGVAGADGAAVHLAAGRLRCRAGTSGSQEAIRMKAASGMPDEEAGGRPADDQPRPRRGYNAIAELFGYRVVRFGGGRCVAEWTPAPPFVNMAGGVWGGAVSAIVDNICAMAVAAAIDPPPHHLPTVSMHVDFLRPLAVGETYLLHGHALRVGRRLAVADTHIRDAGGELLARATCTFTVHR